MKPIKLAPAALSCLLVVPALAQAAPAARGERIAASQETATLLAMHRARERPKSAGKVVAFVRARRPITGTRTVLPVVARRFDSRGRYWLRVRLPGRTLGSRAPPQRGWIRAWNTRRSATSWHIVVDVGLRRVAVYRGGRRVRAYPAIVGRRSTPTPLGDYFVEENVRLSSRRTGAPFALATSARSNVLQEFDGGPGQIALHGRDNIGGRLGTSVSHGCVRLGDIGIRWLAARIGPGVPITIVSARRRRL